ncbi:MAG: ABC transporter permease [Deltaproteobacteria bacterium]|nr:ABC transporter permease [Deltaproteobacteria bacterium]
MFLTSAFQMAARQIRRHGMRSALTTLGVVIGTAAVIAMVTLGRGTTARISDEIGKIGRNLLFVAPGAPRHGAAHGRVTAFALEDARAIAREVRGLVAVAPTAMAPVLAVYGNNNWRTMLSGVDHNFLVVREWTLATGRAFQAGEERSGAAVCILGDTVRGNLFVGEEPLGRSIRVANVSCEVIGVLASRGRSTMGEDQDDLVLMPLLAVQRRIAGNQDVGAILVSAADGESTARIQEDITRLMRQRRHITGDKEDDFAVRDLKELADLAARTTGILTTLLAAIAAVSLLVGGIGIMNIMLVSVTERTREIGIRLAIGARAREILLQFLIEAVVLSAMGGVLGIGVGLGGSYLAARALELPFVIDVPIVIIAFVFSAAVGVSFGFFPARKAARLDPIVALRFE